MRLALSTIRSALGWVASIVTAAIASARVHVRRLWSAAREMLESEK
ncbi:MAG TPA: hypothetical protein PLU39_16940 [Armatimonadota bacterium]|nr:hypothetical protein [Armatimonadota bacterium]HOM82584.1 hypothetical protein [Armatimonadota bacterium]HPO73537.1 hypothetical protein [Armatimonadota bacterium]HPT99549.1 hypothetical protein [Armatimonadota bacterium]